MITIIVLWILLGIIAVIVILLHFSITAQIDLNKKGFDLKVRYMFFDIYPRKPKKKKQKRSKKAELPEDSFDDFEEFEDNIEESLPIPQTDDTTDKKGEVSEQIVEAKPENIAKNEADGNVSVSDVEDKQEVISDIDTDTKVEAGAEDKPEEINVKQYKKVKPYIPMGWKYFKKLLKAIRFTDTRIVLDVGKEDAYEAAMLYGKVQAGLFNTIAILAGVFTVKLKKADVNCIFDEKKFGYDVHTLVRVRPSTLIAIGFCTGVNFLKIYLSGRRKKKRAAKRRSKELAAKKNEVKATN